MCCEVETGGGRALAVGRDLCSGDVIAKPQCGFKNDLITSLKDYVDE